jgi:hypothetical protein
MRPLGKYRASLPDVPADDRRFGCRRRWQVLRRRHGRGALLGRVPARPEWSPPPHPSTLLAHGRARTEPLATVFACRFAEHPAGSPLMSIGECREELRNLLHSEPRTG